MHHVSEFHFIVRVFHSLLTLDPTRCCCRYTISLTRALHLPAWLCAYSSRPAPSCWMYRPMHIKWKNFSSTVLFWGITLTMKLPFDYFVICKPLVKPVSTCGYAYQHVCIRMWCMVSRCQGEAVCQTLCQGLLTAKVSVGQIIMPLH